MIAGPLLWGRHFVTRAAGHPPPPRASPSSLLCPDHLPSSCRTLGPDALPLGAASPPSSLLLAAFPLPRVSPGLADPGTRRHSPAGQVRLSRGRLGVPREPGPLGAPAPLVTVVPEDVLDVVPQRGSGVQVPGQASAVVSGLLPAPRRREQARQEHRVTGGSPKRKQVLQPPLPLPFRSGYGTDAPQHPARRPLGRTVQPGPVGTAGSGLPGPSPAASVSLLFRPPGPPKGPPMGQAARCGPGRWWGRGRLR